MEEDFLEVEQQIDLNEKLEVERTHAKLGLAMKNLLVNPDFNLVFSDTFIDNWSLSQIHNLHSYDINKKQKYMENAMARSIFSQFIDEVIADGNRAAEAIRVMQTDLDELNKPKDNEQSE